MGFAKLKKQVHAIASQTSFLCRIKNNEDYETALKLMEDLIEDYDYNRLLIEILSRSIELWEESAPQFQEFNKRIKMIKPGIALLKTLMDQYKLGVSDFPEIGSKSLVSKIVNGKRRLTLNHIQALSRRFNLDPAMFFDDDEEGNFSQSLCVSKNKAGKKVDNTNQK